MKDDILGGLDFAKMKEMQILSNRNMDALRGTAITKFASSLTMARAIVDLDSSISEIKESLNQVAINTIKELNTPLLESIRAMQRQSIRVMENFQQAILEGINKDIALGYEIMQNIYPTELLEGEQQDIDEVDQKILTEICNEDNQKRDLKDSDIIIVAAPISDLELKFFAENPDALYHLNPDEFEKVMAEMYSQLGYDVERTKLTRDDGKDLILRKSEPFGNLVYYVECKRYSPTNKVGVGIVRAFSGVIDMDRVNGGIIATTSHFTRDAKNLIMDKNLKYQVQMHDIEKIRELLIKAVK